MKTVKNKLLWIILFTLLCGSIGDFQEYIPQLQAQEVHDEHSNSGGHGDEVAPIYIIVFALIFGAVVGRFVAKMLNQPAVLGELVIGLIFGTLIYQYHQPVMIIMRHNDQVEKIMDDTIKKDMTLREAIEQEIPQKSLEKGEYGEALSEIMARKDFYKYLQIVIALKIFSAFGVILLLFMVGLECSYSEMKAVGGSSFSAALVGIIAPFFMGFYATRWLVPGLDNNTYIFIGATLCATSIGITARVFKDMNKLNTPEAKVVMGAAVIDDILGLIILAVVTGIIATGHVEVSTISFIVFKAFFFLFVAIFVVGKFLSKYTYTITILDRSNARLLFTLSLLMLFAWASDKIGLASIVGAFAAGLILEERFFEKIKGDHFSSIEEAIAPIESLFAPMFFVMMGMMVDVTTFADPTVIKIALILTVVAIIGKLIAGWAVKKGLNNLVIGVGLIPRGEVGLIFASIGKTIGVLNEGLFSAIIAVVMLTTFVTPPLLKWLLEEKISKKTEQQSETNQSSNKETKKSTDESATKANNVIAGGTKQSNSQENKKKKNNKKGKKKKK